MGVVAASAEVKVAAPPWGRRGTRPSYPNWFYLPAAIIYGLLFLVPTVASFFFSLTRWTLSESTFIGLDNFTQFFSEPFLVQGLVNTLIYGVVTSGLKVVLGLLLAVLLTSDIVGRSYLRAVVFFPVLVSTIGVGITFTVMMHPTQGMINETLGLFGIKGPGWLTDPRFALISVALVDVWKGVGLATVIYIAGIASISRDYYEAAIIDGANGVQNFWHITLPLVRPATDDRGHPVADRRAALLRPHLGDDPRRPGLHLRRDRVGDLQAVPGRLLRALDRRQCRPVRRRRRDHLSAVVVAEPQ